MPRRSSKSHRANLPDSDLDAIALALSCIRPADRERAICEALVKACEGRPYDQQMETWLIVTASMLFERIAEFERTQGHA